MRPDPTVGTSPDRRTTARIRRLLIITNPTAGRGNARTIAQHLARDLEAAGIHAQIIDPTNLPDEPSLAAADAVAVVGGDGTLRAVAGRCLQLCGRIPPLLLLPIGTANLMARHLGISAARDGLVRRAVDSVRSGNVVHLDAARANGELLLLIAGVGIDGHIVHNLARRRTGPIRYASYLIPSIAAFAAYQFTPIEVWVDDAPIFPSAPAMAFIGNISEYGTGFAMTPSARSDDELLDICVIPVSSRAGILLHFARAAMGRHQRTPGVISTRGRRVMVKSPHPIPVQLDGDAAGFTPLTVELMDVRLPMILPATAEP
jgi:diacylglycerol kinase (ATP)